MGSDSDLEEVVQLDDVVVKDVVIMVDEDEVEVEDEVDVDVGVEVMEMALFSERENGGSSYPRSIFWVDC